ncbi:MAG TPA: bifunctional UDP-N-acetylglucosamine diphosphorylase/glucosamine-1-phosphate N-acetyltransferase GlmU [Nocardioides sp.]|uniref:bifunctional UDP-N-acetylglucosamine diphosphorylase/glucosamine-1-phosphate N-acetyltransferase GlmU n=1 Tax=Nocardioides sp. TaxID=35761 RepID=UPI002E31835F|nr:bifunctional UDP-N-acetylglucosamine diphosphorylase/glucosamine-1-phosphate N-acetyltransferase GlmU [Nocardioides sp.]HEX5088986.1 bifunctional UDP-N-acetylglucosamine diphosphorylase/glucosamine-1-phosphate N-acetyltransferase GlmU [Nocardioides sp.]
MPGELTVIVLAAGGGTRMKSKTMKVLHPVAGRSMVGHVLAAVQQVQPRRIVAVVGHQRDQVAPHIQSLAPEVLLAVQEEQHGTGHAVQVAMDAVAAAGEVPEGTVLVAYADTPLLEAGSLRRFAEEHEAAQRAVSILSAVVADPFGYGRVVRNEDGEVEGVVEEKDATDEQRTIQEISSGILAFDATFLAQALPKLSNDNAKGEYYLTDTVGLAREAGLHVGAHELDDVLQTEGVNDRVQLARTGRVMNERIVTRWMEAGVTVMDPATTWIDADVVLSPDVTLLPGVQLLGATVVAEDAVIGPDTTLKDCEVGEGARVVRTHAELSVIGPGADVGPYARLRPGSVLGAKGKIGTFVETKNAQIADGAKVPHLSYVGDAEIGEGSNIGAGTIFANYDGVAKHRTKVGRYARTGANNTFVAPVEVGDGAGTAGGTVVRRNVPPGALAVSGGPQRNLERWAISKRAGTPQADAAAAALDGVEHLGEEDGE